MPHAYDNAPAAPWYGFLPRGDFTLRCHLCDCAEKDYIEHFKELLSSNPKAKSAPAASLSSTSSSPDTSPSSPSKPFPKTTNAAIDAAEHEDRKTFRIQVSARSVAALLCAVYPGNRRFLIYEVEIYNIVEAMELAAGWGMSEMVRSTLLLAAIGLIGRKKETHLLNVEYHNLTRLFVEAHRHGEPSLDLLGDTIDEYRDFHLGGAPVVLPELKMEKAHIKDIGRNGSKELKEYLDIMDTCGVIRLVKPKRERVQRVVVAADWA